MEKVKADYETCKKCVYHGYYSSSYCLCSYILIEKHSRIYDGGKRMVEKGYCDKFVSIENKDELERVKEVKIKNNV